MPTIRRVIIESGISIRCVISAAWFINLSALNLRRNKVLIKVVILYIMALLSVIVVAREDIYI